MLLALVRHVKTGGLHVKNDHHAVKWIITHMNIFQHCSKVRDLLLVSYMAFEPNQVKLGIKMFVHLQYYNTIEQYFDSNIIQPKITK